MDKNTKSAPEPVFDLKVLTEKKSSARFKKCRCGSNIAEPFCCGSIAGDL